MIDATNVPRMDLLGKADPYVCLWTRETRKMHTAVRSYTLNPVWQVWRTGQPTASFRPRRRRRLPIATLLMRASPGELVSHGAQAVSIAAAANPRHDANLPPCAGDVYVPGAQHRAPELAS